MNKDIDILRYYIPDYIRGNIYDKEILLLLENEINKNINFRKEYEELRNTLDFINFNSNTGPDELYFNSILPRLNNKIDYLRSPKSSLINILVGIRNHWKYLLPVLPVILIIMIYRINFTNTTKLNVPKENITLSENDSSILQNKVNLEIASNDNSKEIFQDETESSDTQLTNNVLDTFKLINNENINQVPEYLPDESFSDNSEKTDIFSKEEDFINSENEFSEQNEETQIEILNNLKNIKL